MIIFAALFLGLYSVLSPFFTALFTASEAVMTFAAIIILGSIAVAIFARSRMAWMACFLGILAYVAIELLAPHASMVIICLTAMGALVGTIAVKRPIIRWIRADAHRPAAQGGPVVPQWARGILIVL